MAQAPMARAPKASAPTLRAPTEAAPVFEARVTDRVGMGELYAFAEGEGSVWGGVVSLPDRRGECARR